MFDIVQNISILKSQLPQSVKLVAVSKTKPVSDILKAYNTGQRCFGENRVQEIISKKDHLPSDIEWHLIGHLQSNKVKSIVSFISMIESVDSFRLLQVINSEAQKAGRKIDCLLQIYIASEETKYGFTIQELKKELESGVLNDMHNISICGVMGMATCSTDTVKIEHEFRTLREYFLFLKDTFFKADNKFREISMGMSGDYELAVKEGSTMVRIGSLIFGER